MSPPPAGKYDHEEVATFRDLWMVPGHNAAARRIVAQQRVLAAAWGSLDLFPYRDAEEYLEAPVNAALGHSAVRDKASAEEVAALRSRLVHVAVAFALTAVEAERERAALEPAEPAPPPPEPDEEGREYEDDIPF